MPAENHPSAEGRRLRADELPQQPVIFMLQPTHYEVLPPERLSEWEADMRERVGLDLPGLDVSLQSVQERGYSATTSFIDPGEWIEAVDSDISWHQQ